MSKYFLIILMTAGFMMLNCSSTVQMLPEPMEDKNLLIGSVIFNIDGYNDMFLTLKDNIEVAVIGLPDNLLGTKLMALAVTKDDTTDNKQLMNICASGLPKFKQPSGIIITRTLPKNANGKIDKQACIVLAKKALLRN